MKEDEDIEEYANSEIRYLTIELMKIAIQQNKTFDTILKEFISNTYKLKKEIENASEQEVL